MRQVDPQRFPLYARATQYHTVLHPGDMVFVPSRWWHGARALSPSISICQNMLDGSNWGGYVAELCSRKSGLPGPKRYAKRAYLSALGGLLSMLEHWPRRSAAGSAGRVARLAPVTCGEAGDSSSWPVASWKVR